LTDFPFWRYSSACRFYYINQWLIDILRIMRSLARLRRADEKVNRTQAALEKQNELAANQGLAIQQEIADGKKTQEVANKELAAQLAKTAAITQALLDAQKQAAADPPASWVGAADSTLIQYRPQSLNTPP
jgi:hypothetical protein